MNIMAAVPPPFVTARQQFEGEEIINLYKSLNIALTSIAQTTPLQQSLAEHSTSPSLVPNNTGRIILYTTSKQRDLAKLQEFLATSIDECNKLQLVKNDQQSALPFLLPLDKIELVIIDVSPVTEQLQQQQHVVKEMSPLLRTRVIQSRAGKALSFKLIQLTKCFYELGTTSITNIPMKEELNANSSANYDVDLLHEKSVHDQLKVCGLFRQSLVSSQKSAASASDSSSSSGSNDDIVCLTWSNPKMNINDFATFSSRAYRVTPVDVNSRPSSCLTTFILNGRTVVLEATHKSNKSFEGKDQPQQRVYSHVLCNFGNEIFIMCLNCCGSNKMATLDTDRFTSFQAQSPQQEKTVKYRTTEFAAFIKANMLGSLPYVTPFGSTLLNEQQQQQQRHVPVDLASQQKAIIFKFQKMTKKWPLTYGESLLTNINIFQSFVTNITSESMSESQFNECMQLILVLETAEKNDQVLLSLPNVCMLIPSPKFRALSRKEQYALLWQELEQWLRAYQELSDRHRLLYERLRKTRHATLQNDKQMSQLFMAQPQKASTPPPPSLAAKKKKHYSAELNIENEKLLRRKKLIRLATIDQPAATPQQQRFPALSLLDMWSNLLQETMCKKQLDFYGRTQTKPNQIAALYPNLKIDADNVAPNVAKSYQAASKMDVS